MATLDHIALAASVLFRSERGGGMSRRYLLPVMLGAALCASPPAFSSEIPLYGENGEVVAYYDDEGDNSLYFTRGQPVGRIYNGEVRDLDGNLLGSFRDGVFSDGDGNVYAVQEYRASSSFAHKWRPPRFGPRQGRLGPW